MMTQGRSIWQANWCIVPPVAFPLRCHSVSTLRLTIHVRKLPQICHKRNAAGLSANRTWCFCLGKSGEPSRTRTCAPLVKSQLLYQLSYRPTNLRQSKVSSIKFQVDGSEVANSLWERVGVRDEVSAEEKYSLSLLFTYPCVS